MKRSQAGLAAGAGPGEWFAWLLALAAAAIVLGASRYESRDPDSALYAVMSADLAQRPVREWIAPEWNGHWELEGLYREHPAGLFVVAAAVVRLGYPPLQAAYFVNAAYQILTVLLMLALARQFLGRRDARLLVTLMLLLPIAFTYRIRANQEQPLLMFLLLTLYGLERSRASVRWAALSAAGMVGLFLVKGIFVAVAAAAVVAWLGVRQWRWPEKSGGLRPWGALALSVATLALVFIVYDAAYTRVVGEPFSRWYWARQFGVAVASGTPHPILGALLSVGWYLVRIAWFTAPWCAAALAGLWRWLRQRHEPSSAAPRDAVHDAATQGALFCAVVSGTYLVAFSVFERRADRYIFPVYYLAAGWWAAYAFRVVPRLRRLAWRATRVLYPYEQAALWAGLFFLAMVAAWLGLPIIKI